MRSLLAAQLARLLLVARPFRGYEIASVDEDGARGRFIADSLKEMLRREPRTLTHRAPHAEAWPIITAPTDEVPRFFDRRIRFPGIGSESTHRVRRLHE